MSLMRVNPTRMELTRLKRQLATAKRGHKLLKDKQDEMIRQFMLLIRKNRSLRIEVEEALSQIMKKFSMAKLKMSRVGMIEAMMVPSQATTIEVGSKSVMNIRIPTIKYETQKAIDLTYGFAFTPSELDQSIIDLSHLLPKMIELAQLDKSCDMLSKEIEKTRRRVNAIEFIMIPDMTESIRYIQMKLEDNERSNIIRLMKSKEIILEKANQLKEY
ncbi:MAG TPA: V-type ATP synthase subunit D [Bacilli bacterium]|jgi:V/A-type H+-transporting ATPase subunit D|nr:V-type ATP synthase subunit D [Acholeplasmataceae bacterium]HNZ77472.1 V-type ATP synthase subunit D [Bacilli bacterium]HOH61343.1 V-type ATP synthase subunit D [Bacilli bacterium]HPM14950.1 V-type ATP synthase subunit D [Bacilli bacterium]HPY54771.1 V-type ATP synthase subunit D [Bacilli bacterium]